MTYTLRLYAFVVLSSLINLSCFPAVDASSSSLCKQWGSPEKLGELDASQVTEASGLAISSVYPGRAYYINDSGDGPFFYQSDLTGRKMRKIEITGFYPTDTEDLAYGNCGSQKCLIVGDIGDNGLNRSKIQFVVIGEKEDFGKKVTPQRIIKARYPDGAQNAEALALHPDGTLYVVTKDTRTAKVYRLANEIWQTGDEERTYELEYVGQWELWKVFQLSAPGSLVTSMDIHPENHRTILLTYDTAIELDFDLSGSFKSIEDWHPGVDVQLVPIKNLKQQESVSFLPSDETGNMSFIYNTEKSKNDPAAQYRVRCLVR